MFLHKEYAGTLGIHGDMVHAVADLRILIRDILRAQSAVDRLPILPAIVGAEGARRRDGNPNPLRIAGIENDGVQTQAARARLPFRASAMAAQAGEFLPVLSAVGRTLNQLSKPAARLRRVNAIGISGRSFEVIHFPACKMRAANIPFFALAVRGQNERALACAY